MKKKKVVKKYENGGTVNSKKVAANKAKVEANRKKVEANREKVVLGKYAPNTSSHSVTKDVSSSNKSTDSKGNLQTTNKTTFKGSDSKGTMYTNSYTAFSKPRVTNTATTYNKVGNDYKFKDDVKSATSMDTTGYAAGKKSFVQNSKVKGADGLYKQTSKKIARKDVPKTLKKMQTFKKGGTKTSKKK